MNILTKTLAFSAVMLFCAQLHADIAVIDGALGNGDFNAGGGGTGGGPQLYTQTPNWFNASGSEGINFTNSTQMGGSTDPNNATTTRGGMPFNDRVQINNSSYTIAAAGQTFSVSYDFGAGGAPANWNGDETMRTFLFTSGVAVDGATTVADISEIASDSYAIDRANDGQWTSYSATNLYTTTASDVGLTVYFGMVFEDLTGSTLFPRIDIVNLHVTEPAAIPEPTSFGLMALTGLVLVRRRR